jgi:tripeptidyl-peptidase-1
MAPDPASVQAVAGWLASEGVSAQVLTGHGDWVGFNTTVAQAGRLFNASFSTYRHLDSGHESVRTMAYSVPASIQEHIQVVYPMTRCADCALTPQTRR